MLIMVGLNRFFLILVIVCLIGILLDFKVFFIFGVSWYVNICLLVSLVFIFWGWIFIFIKFGFSVIYSKYNGYLFVIKNVW